MSKKSAGLLMYRAGADGLEVLLAHPGGPFWAKKDEGVWSIPKGEFEDAEEPLAAARREFEEETGMAPHGDFIPLTPLRQPNGKIVFAWAVAGDFDPASLKSNMFSLEWPPGSGRMREFPEVDRTAWLTVDAAVRKILPGQAPFLRELEEILDRRSRHSRQTG
ncbi:MAG: NUDIX domain-containing protein [Deltaproteobacteria bacterium]|nr:NUDIX domain-containing protein [Deltaproteobacteria bacterium]